MRTTLILYVYLDAEGNQIRKMGVSQELAVKAAIFGEETKKMLRLCTELTEATVRGATSEEQQRLLRKIYGIAKVNHLYVTWYGDPPGAFEPGKFLVSSQNVEKYALISVN